jgi:hypothetical protein
VKSRKSERGAGAIEVVVGLGLLLAAACSSTKHAAPDGSGSTPSDGGVDGGVDHPTLATADAGTDLRADAGRATDAGMTCSFGQASSQATASDLSLFGTPAYFNGGQPIPAGTYRITYVDGCMKYGSGQGWTVNAYADGSDGWWLVGATTGDKILVLPGTVGYAPGSGAFDMFDDCVAASQLSAPVTFLHQAGVLGVWLQDSPYSDNTAGQDDRNPSWRLDGVGTCGDGGAADASHGADADAAHPG